jgi:hypothetical protein
MERFRYPIESAHKFRIRQFSIATPKRRGTRVLGGNFSHSVNNIHGRQPPSPSKEIVSFPYGYIGL